MGAIVTTGDLAELRAMAEAELDDRCVIKRETGYTYADNGARVPTYDTIYDDPDTPGAGGPCRVRMTTNIGINPAADTATGQQHVTVTQVLLQVPVTAVGVQAADVVDVTASLDPQLPSHQFRIDGPFPGQTHAVLRRFWLEIAT